MHTSARPLVLGVFLTSLCTLMYELLLTRIFSVTLMYHFAFMAVSVAMFGMTAGAVAVHLRPGLFADGPVPAALGSLALLFGVTVVGSFLAHLAIPIAATGPLMGL